MTPVSDVVAIVTAAGEGRRMGGDKLTLPLGDSTIVGAAVGSLVTAGLLRIVVVTGFHSHAVREALSSYPVEFVENSSPEEGMLSSIKAAMRGIAANRYLVALGDMPFVKPETVRTIIEVTGPIVIPTLALTRGHPIVLAGALRGEVLALPRDVGLNSLIRANQERVVTVPVCDAGILRDIDLPSDYRV